MLFRRKKNKFDRSYSPTEHIRLTNEEYEALEKMKKATRHRCLFYPEFELHSHRFTTVLFEEMKNKQLEDEEYLKSLLQKGKKFTREELLAECKEKYSITKLEKCPICNNEVKLSFGYHSSGDSWGFPAGYAIDCEIRCLKCTCGLDYVTVFDGEYDKIEKHVKEYVAKWNFRYHKFGAQIVAEKRDTEDQNLYFDNIAFPYDELEEMRRLGRHHCTAPPYFVSVQRPDSYKEDKPDEI